VIDCNFIFSTGFAMVLLLGIFRFIDPKRSEIMSVFQVFPCATQIALFGQNCSLPFSLRRLDIPALLKSWQKHYASWLGLPNMDRILRFVKS
jgi:hypothetical protein